MASHAQIFFDLQHLGLRFEKIIKSQSRILNEGLGISASLGFNHSLPLMYLDIVSAYVQHLPQSHL